MEGVVNRSPAAIEVHDLMLDANPDQHPADCSICKDRAPATTDVEDHTVDEAALQAQIDQLSADLSTANSTIADLRTEIAGSQTAADLASMEAERDKAVTDKETAEAALDSLRTEFETFKNGLQALTDADAEKARLEDLAVERAEVVSKLGYSKDFVEAEGRAASWAAMDEAAWDVRLAELTETKPKTTDVKDPVPDPTKVKIGDDGQPTALDNESVKDLEQEKDEPTFRDMLRNRDRVAAL